MTTTPPAGSEKWTDEQREVWRKLVEAQPIKALPPEMREALSVFAAYLVETPYSFITDLHRGTGEAVGENGIPSGPTLLGSLDDLVSSLHPHAEGAVLRVSRVAFERIMCASQKKWRDVTPNIVDHPNYDPDTGRLVAYYNGVRIEAKP